MADGFKSVVQVAREIADAMRRSPTTDLGEEGSLRGELVKTVRALAEREFLELIALHMHEGRLRAVSAISGAPFNHRAARWPATDAVWMLSPDDQRNAWELLGPIEAQDAQAVQAITQGPAEAPRETAAQRQERRYRMCIEAGLTMPSNDYAKLPRGIGNLANAEGIRRQSFAEDVKAHIRRLNGR